MEINRPVLIEPIGQGDFIVIVYDRREPRLSRLKKIRIDSLRIRVIDLVFRRGRASNIRQVKALKSADSYLEYSFSRAVLDLMLLQKLTKPRKASPETGSFVLKKSKHGTGRTLKIPKTRTSGHWRERKRVNKNMPI